MPIYEYRCSDCKKKVSVFFRSLSMVDHGKARCPECGGANLTRLVSRVRAIRSEESRLDNLETLKGNGRRGWPAPLFYLLLAVFAAGQPHVAVSLPRLLALLR